eukprot:372507-Hanusia_phi.AAC.8
MAGSGLPGKSASDGARGSGKQRDGKKVIEAVPKKQQEVYSPSGQFPGKLFKKAGRWRTSGGDL